MVALQYVSGRTASPLLRTVLSDPSEDLRLLAYGMLDTLEKRVNRSIDAELSALRAAQAEEGSAGLGALESAQRLSDLYWELIYQELVQGDLRKHAIKESLLTANGCWPSKPDNAATMPAARPPAARTKTPRRSGAGLCAGARTGPARHARAALPGRTRASTARILPRPMR